jgi:hypothetical protein
MLIDHLATQGQAAIPSSPPTYPQVLSFTYQPKKLPVVFEESSCRLAKSNLIAGAGVGFGVHPWARLATCSNASVFRGSSGSTGEEASISGRRRATEARIKMKFLIFARHRSIARRDTQTIETICARLSDNKDKTKRSICGTRRRDK